MTTFYFNNADGITVLTVKAESYEEAFRNGVEKDFDTMMHDVKSYTTKNHVPKVGNLNLNNK